VTETQAVKEATKRARASGLDAIVAKLLDVEFSEKLAKALTARSKKAAAMLQENLANARGGDQLSAFKD
jgi:hypothetical protein